MFCRVLLFLFTLIAFTFSCRNTKNLPSDATLRMVFHARANSSQVCVFRIQQENDNSTNLCRSDLIPGPWAECVVYSNAPEPDFDKFPARSAYNQFLRTLSDIELNHKQIKKQLDSVLVIGSEGKMLENEKIYFAEFKKGFEKFRLKGYGKTLPKDQSMLTLGNNLFDKEENALLLMMDSLESKFLSLDEYPSKRKVTKDSITGETIWNSEEKKGAEFAACRQAFSQSLRSTGKSGMENAILCREMIRKQIQTSKVLPVVSKSPKQNLYVYGEIWESLGKILGSSEIQRTSLEQKQVDFCYLSGLELMKKKKLPKEISLRACYYVSFGLEYLDGLGYSKAQVLPEASLSRAASISSDIFPECKAKALPKK